MKPGGKAKKGTVVEFEMSAMCNAKPKTTDKMLCNIQEQLRTCNLNIKQAQMMKATTPKDIILQATLLTQTVDILCKDVAIGILKLIETDTATIQQTDPALAKQATQQAFVTMAAKYVSVLGITPEARFNSALSALKTKLAEAKTLAESSATLEQYTTLYSIKTMAQLQSTNLVDITNLEMTKKGSLNDSLNTLIINDAQAIFATFVTRHIPAKEKAYADIHTIYKMVAAEKTISQTPADVVIKKTTAFKNMANIKLPTLPSGISF